MKIHGSVPMRLLALLFLVPASTQGNFKTTVGDFDIDFYGMLKPEMFYGKNIALLNNNNDGNQIWYARHTIDLNLDLQYGGSKYDRTVVEMMFNLRNRGTWGSPESIAATTDSEIKRVDVVSGKHKHSIPRHFFWMRELWLAFELNEALAIPFDNTHTFKVGIFPFELGRGIALGDAFAVGQELLGFYTETIIDQFAPGAVLHGDLLGNRLSYDLYAALLRNNSTSLSETAAAILGQEFGRRKNPQRGSWKINYAVAGRVVWDAFNNDRIGKLRVEPYVLYNHDPEQKVEFTADASSHLGTLGLAAEYSFKKFEFGFDSALNLGQQRVKGWDRNRVEEQNRNGQLIVVNSDVVDQNGKKIPFVRGSDAQKIIDCAPQDESQDGKIIGTVDSVGFLSGPVTLINSDRRFRNPYTNKYEGWMFVVDAAYWAFNKDLQFAVATGIATGDENPNNETKDGTYTGFIGLQEIYSGKRVRSAFVLGGAGKLRRPLSAPESEQAPSEFSQTVSGFTNLVFFGTSAKWKPSQFKREFVCQPNMLAYWQEKPTKKFDARTNSDLDCFASNYLGTELNLFSHYMLFENLKMFLVGSVFFPGSHYRDIRGKPLTRDESALLDELDRTGFDDSRIPNLGADTSYTLNVGFEFKF